jgi:hypothetical protein
MNKHRHCTFQFINDVNCRTAILNKIEILLQYGAETNDIDTSDSDVLALIKSHFIKDAIDGLPHIL